MNDLTASYGAEIISGDLAANTVTFSAYAAPKTYTEGMTAVFLVEDGIDTLEIPGELGENHTFSARLTCALTDGINISVVFITGGVRETQLLETYSGLYVNSLPDVGDVRTTSSTPPAAAPVNQGQRRFFGGCWAAR
mgnify:CR=1 FL=1